MQAINRPKSSISEDKITQGEIDNKKSDLRRLYEKIKKQKP